MTDVEIRETIRRVLSDEMDGRIRRVVAEEVKAGIGEAFGFGEDAAERRRFMTGVNWAAERAESGKEVKTALLVEIAKWILTGVAGAVGGWFLAHGGSK